MVARIISLVRRVGKLGDGKSQGDWLGPLLGFAVILSVAGWLGFLRLRYRQKAVNGTGLKPGIVSPRFSSLSRRGYLNKEEKQAFESSSN